MVGERIWNLTRMYWMRENETFNRSWDMPPSRFYEEPPTTGASKGMITKYEDVIRLLDMYYEQRGWSKEGLPEQSTLERLGIASLVA
jgi:aldehyde:ferredoxin oxidoreductase